MMFGLMTNQNHTHRPSTSPLHPTQSHPLPAAHSPPSPNFVTHHHPPQPSPSLPPPSFRSPPPITTTPAPARSPPPHRRPQAPIPLTFTTPSSPVPIECFLWRIFPRVRSDLDGILWQSILTAVSTRPQPQTVDRTAATPSTSSAAIPTIALPVTPVPVGGVNGTVTPLTPPTAQSSSATKFSSAPTTPATYPIHLLVRHCSPVRPIRRLTRPLRLDNLCSFLHRHLQPKLHTSMGPTCPVAKPLLYLCQSRHPTALHLRPTRSPKPLD